MNRLLINSIIIGFITILTPIIVRAQLFEENELFPNVTTIKGKYFNGTGSGGYWSLDFVDSIGRVVKKESYHKNQLISRRIVKYDNYNNKTLDIQTVDFNNPGRIDTTKYEYKYVGNRIIYQCHKLSDIDSTVIEKIESEGDSVFRYQEMAFYYRPKTGKTDVYETIYTLKYRNGLLISNEIHDKERNSKEIKTYEYYDNRRLKRRIIKRTPKPAHEAVYVGGPRSDDEFYKYKLDSEGRIVKFYRIINGKKYKIAVYKYNEK